MIEIKHLSKTFQMKDGAVNALKDISLTIPDGSIYGIIGIVDAHGLNVDAGNGDQVGALLLIEVVQVGLMLEVVGIALAILNDGVGDHIVIVLLDVQRDALVGQDLLADLQHLCLR